MPTQQFPLWRSLVALWRSSFISSNWQWSLFSHTSIFRRTTIPLKPMNNKSVMSFKLSLCKSSFSQKLEKLKMKLSFQLNNVIVFTLHVFPRPPSHVTFFQKCLQSFKKFKHSPYQDLQKEMTQVLDCNRCYITHESWFNDTDLCDHRRCDYSRFMCDFRVSSRHFSLWY